MSKILKLESELETITPVDVYLQKRNRDDIFKAWIEFGNLGFDSSDISYENSSNSEFSREFLET